VKFNLDRGAILGLSHSFFNVLSFRPSIRHFGIQGLYFVGASTHPGAGVPVALSSAKIVAENVLADASEMTSRQGSNFLSVVLFLLPLVLIGLYQIIS
jgi:phytoene desaturase (3,4-didehydrolycopene-forming)